MASCRIAVLCLLGLLAASPAVADSDSGIYYQIGLLWPGAFCEQINFGCCVPVSPFVPESDFYVSGFTVYDATTDAPMTGCSGPPFNFTQAIKVDKIWKYWSNIKCPSNIKGWESAWKTSGVCSGLDQSAYFGAALALRQKINPFVRLFFKNIRPNYGSHLYTVENIKKVFKAEIHVTPVIQCSKVPFDHAQLDQLYQIFVCVAGDAKTLIECPNPQKFTCSDEILFLPVQRWRLKLGKSSVSDAEAFELYGAAMDH